jgi:2,5-furandicarboxylate decarboxylase 1
MAGLASFLAIHQDSILRIRKPVKLDHVGALVAQAGRTVVFESLCSYPEYQLADLLFVDRKAQARVLECEPSSVVRRLAEIVRLGPKPLRLVGEGACQERVFTGDDVDLGMLPIPRHTDLDPYPYTTSFAIHRDPATGQFNQMFPRAGVLGPREMVTSFVTPTANRILAAHRAAGTRMPQAIAIGTHPAWELCGCYSHPHDGWSELELFESMTGRPGEVVKCATVDLMVPADASIVIEGYISPTRTAQDGPSPGPTMLYTPYASQQPVFEVTAITTSGSPVYRHHQMTPFTDHQEMPRLFHEAILYERLRAMGLRVLDVHFPSGGGALSVILQVEPAADGQVADALLAALGSPWSNTKMAIAVDPDINIYDERDVHYAIATRVDPSRDVTIIGNARGWMFDPTARPILEAGPDAAVTRSPSLVGKWAIDATKPAPYRAAERKSYERAWPIGWGEIQLADYLEGAERESSTDVIA